MSRTLTPNSHASSVASLSHDDVTSIASDYLKADFEGVFTTRFGDYPETLTSSVDRTINLRLPALACWVAGPLRA
jgi:hypothetical protein